MERQVILSCTIPPAGTGRAGPPFRTTWRYAGIIRIPQGFGSSPVQDGHAREGGLKWAVPNKMPCPVFLSGCLDSLSKESPLIRKNYPASIPSLVPVDSNGNKNRFRNRDGLIRKKEELASAAKEKTRLPNPNKRSIPTGVPQLFPASGHENVKQPRKITFRGCSLMFTEQMDSAAS